MKKLAVLVLLLSALSLCALSVPIYKYENTEYITESVTLTKVEEFHSDHNISYTYIKMDLTDDRVKLKLLTSDEGIDVLDTVKNLALQDENTVAALNGDFFSVYSANKGFALGMEKTDGQILQSPIYPDTMATVAYNGSQVLMSYLDFHVMAVAPNWEYAPIRHINKHTSYYGDILMYTSDFNGGYSPAPGGDMIEVVVEDGIVTELRRNMEPCLIPENGCVLVVSEGSSMFFSNNFSIGDEIKFDWYITPSLDEFDTAFGGGAMLVYEGKDCGKTGDYTHAVAGLNPRSAIGVTQDGTTLFLVAVNGRQQSSRGMRMSHLAELMIELGCYTAVNLDGGGSTSMVASTMWTDGIVSVNSPTENRKVINAVGVVLNNEEKDLSDNETDASEEENEKDETVKSEPVGIEIRADKEITFADSAVKLKVVAFDENKRPIDFDEEELVWYCSEGTVEDFRFLSENGGKNTVGVWLGELYAETEIYVVDTVSGIETDKTLYLNKGESKKPKVHIFDYYGRYIDVTDEKFLEVTSSDESVVLVKDGVVTAKGDGTATVTFSRDGVKSHISVAVGSRSMPFLCDFEEENITLSVYPSDTKGGYELSDEYSFSSIKSGKLSFDFTEDVSQDETDEKSAEEIFEDESENAKDSAEKEDVSRAVYISLGENIVVHNDCKTLSVRVFCETEFLHKIKLQLVDADGNIKLLSQDQPITAGQWTKLSFEIGEDVMLPVHFSKLYVLYTPGEEKDAGCVYFDDLTFETSEDYKAQNTEENVYRYNPLSGRKKHSITISALSAVNSASPVSVYSNTSLAQSILQNNGLVIEKNMQMHFSEDEYALYVYLDTSKGGIRNTSPSQWDALVSAVNESSKDNLFILTNYDIFGTDEFENEVVKDYLASLDKSVFVISSGDGEGYKNIKGVRYLTLDSSEADSMSLGRNKKSNTVEFVFGDTVGFRFVKG